MTDRQRTPLRLVDTADASTTESESLLVASPQEAIMRAMLTIVHHPTWDLVGLGAAIGERGAILGRTSRACLPGAFDVGKVSREHAEVRFDRGAVTLRDCGSRNGTRLNGEPVEQATLNPGDIVELGGILLMLTVGPGTFSEPDDPHILGRSWAVAGLIADIERAASSEHAVTLVGETGTGKELSAEGIHARSSRANGPFVAVNCSALSDGLIESELFGHEQGAFTGADSARAGLVAHADGGTLFLDEVTSTPPRLQAVMLRLLENGTYRPVGGNQQLRADVRVVAAAQPDIVASIDDGSFRSDLWFRLSRRIVELPSLADRREDIPLLARHFARAVRPDAELTAPLSRALIAAEWPGNVRQLRNVVERIAEASPTAELSDTSTVPSASRAASVDSPRLRQRRSPTERPSRDTLVELLTQEQGRVSAVARRLGVGRKSLYRWLQAHGIDPEALRSSDDPSK
jgi:transcriptional regulator with AAA-type ATPase domain